MKKESSFGRTLFFWADKVYSKIVNKREGGEGTTENTICIKKTDQARFAEIWLSRFCWFLELYRQIQLKNGESPLNYGD